MFIKELKHILTLTHNGTYLVHIHCSKCRDDPNQSEFHRGSTASGRSLIFTCGRTAFPRQIHERSLAGSKISNRLHLVGRVYFTQIHSFMVYIGIVVKPNNCAEVLKCNIYIIDLEVEVEMSLTSMDRDKKQNTVVGILVNARVANSIQHQLTILGNTLAEPRRTPTLLNIVDIAILYTLELRDICPSIIS